MSNSNCFYCGAVYKSEKSMFCTECGVPRPKTVENYCTNPECERYTKKHEFNSKDLTCDMCGKPTSLGNKIQKFT